MEGRENDDTVSENPCAICHEPLSTGPTVELRQKGSEGVNKASRARGDNIKTVEGQTVHVKCRSDYTNQKLIQIAIKKKNEATPNTCPTTRSKGDGFKFDGYKDQCFFCGMPAKVQDRKRGYDVHFVKTGMEKNAFQATIENVCKERNDSWGDNVYARIQFIKDLRAADAVYHQTCSSNFRTNKQIPIRYTGTKKFQQGTGSEKESTNRRQQAFLEVCDYLENCDEEQTTVSDLVRKMEEICGEEAYTTTHIRNKIQQHFGDNIFISTVDGKANVVTFRANASKILNLYFSKPDTGDIELEKRRLIEAAGKLIKSDIKSLSVCKETYPASENISSIEKNLSLVPESLQLLLREVFCEKDNDLKLASLGQAIVQAARPRTLTAPLQIGLAIQMHNHFASKFLIDSLFRHGFSSSYKEVKKFELSAALCQGTDIQGVTQGHFIQYVADNVDHDICTFHGMGLIAARSNPRDQQN